MPICNPPTPSCNGGPLTQTTVVEGSWHFERHLPISWYSICCFYVTYVRYSVFTYRLISLYVRACSVTSVISNSLRPYGLQPTRLFCPWDSPDKNIGVDCHPLLQGIFPTQRSNLSFLHLLHCRQILYPWATWGSPLYPQKSPNKNRRKVEFREKFSSIDLIILVLTWSFETFL